MTVAQEVTVHERPGFEEREPIRNEPVERPAPADTGDEHDFGSVPPSGLEAPTTIER